MTTDQVRARRIIEASGPPTAGWCLACLQMSPVIHLDIMGLDAKVPVCKSCVQEWAAKYGTGRDNDRPE